MDKSIHLTIPEATLTAALQEKLREIHDPRLLVEKAQLAVFPDQLLEVFIPLEVRGKTTAIRFTMTLMADGQGGMTGTAKDVWLGSFHLPSFLAETFSQRFLRQAILQVNTKSAAVISFSDITTGSGELLITGTLVLRPALFPGLK